MSAYRFPHTRLLVFAKAPEPGKVKTRLMPALGADGAARLQRALTLRFLSMLRRSALAPIQLWVAPDPHHAFFAQFAADPHCRLRQQVEGDLGTRMQYAAGHALHPTDGAETEPVDSIILLGTDCPGLTPAHLEQALGWLTQQDAVLGPAADGGYVLLGLRKMHARLFSDIPWSTEHVADITRERFRELGWQWLELEQLADIDRPEDLALLPEEFRKEHHNCAGRRADPVQRASAAPQGE